MLVCGTFYRGNTGLDLRLKLASQTLKNVKGCFGDTTECNSPTTYSDSLTKIKTREYKKGVGQYSVITDNLRGFLTVYPFVSVLGLLTFKGLLVYNVYKLFLM